MPVVLPLAESPEPRPQPPKMTVWLTLLVMVMAGGAVHTLVTWPKDEPTGTPWFWIRLLVIPFLVWAVAFGLRTLYHEQECDRLDALNQTLREDRNQALAFANDPLAVVGSAYLTAAGDSDVAALVANQTEASNEPDTGGAVGIDNASTLTLSGDDDDPSRYLACFNALITSITHAVRKIPNDVPFSVRLQLPESADQQAVLETWQTCWDKKKLRPTLVSAIEATTGLMVLDEWLDVQGGPQLEQFSLFVAAQLRDNPSNVGSEAAVAVLLAWAPLARRHQLDTEALLHRPVEAGHDGVGAAVTTALEWGKTSGAQVSDLWEAGLESSDKTAISRPISDLLPGVAKTENLSGMHYVDLKLGPLGCATGWLAIALGIEHAKSTNRPQLAVWREGAFRAAVAQPAAQTMTEVTV